MENTDINETIEKLSKRIKASVSPYHTAGYVLEELKGNGFTELLPDEEWKLEKGGKYVIRIFGSTVAAFTTGSAWDGKDLRMVAAHTDFPCIKLKPSAQVKENNYIKCNADVYGGAILNTWLDRPLSAAGKVVLKSRNAMLPVIKFIDFERPLFIIPNLAIHMNRDINKGTELNKQKDMLPIMCTCNGTDKENMDVFMDFLATDAGTDHNSILGYDLFLYPVEEPVILGAGSSIFSAGRLDNLTSVQACAHAIMSGTRDNGLNLAVFYDSEETGSTTKQSAGSVVTRSVIERIYNNFGFGMEKFWCGIMSAKGLSLDVAHAIHPNSPEKSDITNKLYMNKGLAIKTDVNEKYASDLEILGIIMQICREADIPCQRYVNRSDMAGGGTLGAVASINLPIKMLDIGVPVLAMHSARETMGVYDQCYLEKVAERFLQDN